MTHKKAIVTDHLLTAAGIVPGAVLIAGEKIVGVVAPKDVPSEYSVDDVSGALVLPGIVDTHVHINQPGRTHWEGFTTATRAAAAGGVTTLVDMPLNCSPVTTTREALDLKIREMAPLLHVDCGFWGGVVPDNCADLSGLLDGGVLGVKAFLADSGLPEFPHVERRHLELALPQLAARSLPLLVHAELESCVAPAVEKGRSYLSYHHSRPEQWELDAIAMLIDLAEKFRSRIHIVHLSSAAALQLLAEARHRGVPISAETCPHYLVLAAEGVPDGDTRFKCAPPIRSNANADKLWQGLAAEVIDFIVSDHSPCSPELKLLEAGDFAGAWGGIASLQLALPLIWSQLRTRSVPPQSLLQWFCAGPAQLAGLWQRKGKLASGYDADVVVWDMAQDGVVKADDLHFRHKQTTPYLGHAIQGRVLRTYLRGQVIFDGQTFGAPSGAAIVKDC